METTAAPSLPVNRLHRSRSNRYIGGVAGGLGEHFGIDPVIFRLLFVALTLAGASGIALYVIAWLLVPDQGNERSILGRWFGSAGRRKTIRNIVLAGVAAFMALAVLALGALGAIAASADVPLRGGIGDRSWAPSSVQEVQRTYRLGAGDMEVDLSDITIPSGVTRVDASVVAGHLTVRVPRGTAVSVDAHAGAGQVTVFGNRDEGRNASHTVEAGSDRRLVLNADAGIGAVDVVRG